MTNTEMTERIIEAENRKQTALADAIELIQADVLTRGEGAQCVAGALLRAQHDLGMPGWPADDRLLDARLLIDQGLDGLSFAGLVIGLHI